MHHTFAEHIYWNKNRFRHKYLNYYIHMFILLYFYILFVCISNSEVKIFKLNFKLNDTIVFFSFFGNWWHLFQKFLNYKSILLNKKKWKFITMLMSSVHRFCKGRELVYTYNIYVLLKTTKAASSKSLKDLDILRRKCVFMRFMQ